jgi:hypothetical protein
MWMIRARTTSPAAYSSAIRRHGSIDARSGCRGLEEALGAGATPTAGATPAAGATPIPCTDHPGRPCRRVGLANTEIRCPTVNRRPSTESLTSA